METLQEKLDNTWSLLLLSRLISFTLINEDNLQITLSQIRLNSKLILVEIQQCLCLINTLDDIV